MKYTIAFQDDNKAKVCKGSASLLGAWQQPYSSGKKLSKLQSAFERVTPCTPKGEHLYAVGLVYRVE